MRNIFEIFGFSIIASLNVLTWKVFGQMDCHSEFLNNYCLYNKNNFAPVHSILAQDPSGFPELAEIWIGFDPSAESGQLRQNNAAILTDICNETNFAPVVGYEWAVFTDDGTWANAQAAEFGSPYANFCPPLFKPNTMDMDQDLEQEVQQQFGWVIEVEGMCNGSPSCPATAAIDDPSAPYDLSGYLSQNKSLCAYFTFRKCFQSFIPTHSPTNAPTQTPTKTPTNAPTFSPTNTPTNAPTKTPTNAPTSAPTMPPTDAPTNAPTDSPTSTPTNSPTQTPTNTPTSAPTVPPTNTPTDLPTKSPTDAPTKTPTNAPSNSPIKSPTNAPTTSPTKTPTNTPTNSPTNSPIDSPTKAPTNAPTSTPTKAPTDTPTKAPTNAPTSTPIKAPTDSPTSSPTAAPTDRIPELTSAALYHDSGVSINIVNGDGLFHQISGTAVSENDGYVYKLYIPQECARGSFIVSGCDAGNSVSMHYPFVTVFDNIHFTSHVGNCGLAGCSSGVFVPFCPDPGRNALNWKFDLPVSMPLAPSIWYLRVGSNTQQTSQSLNYNIDFACIPAYYSLISIAANPKSVIYPSSANQYIHGVLSQGATPVISSDNTEVYLMVVREQCGPNGFVLDACAADGPTKLEIRGATGAYIGADCVDHCPDSGAPQADYCGVGTTHGQTLWEETSLSAGVYYLLVTHGTTELPTNPQPDVDYTISFTCL